MSKVYNKSKQVMEKAMKENCPRCKGFGALFSDNGKVCFLCGGHGSLWVSKTGSGWTRSLYSKVNDSQLY